MWRGGGSSLDIVTPRFGSKWIDAFFIARDNLLAGGGSYGRISSPSTESRREEETGCPSAGIR